MGKFYAFLLGALVGFGIYHVANGQHLVRADNGWHLIAKTSPGLGRVYIDIREFTADDWQENQALANALTQSGNQALLDQSGGEESVSENAGSEDAVAEEPAAEESKTQEQTASKPTDQNIAPIDDSQP